MFIPASHHVMPKTRVVRTTPCRVPINTHLSTNRCCSRYSTINTEESNRNNFGYLIGLLLGATLFAKYALNSNADEKTNRWEIIEWPNKLTKITSIGKQYYYKGRCLGSGCKGEVWEFVSASSGKASIIAINIFYPESGGSVQTESKTLKYLHALNPDS
jgi:hypothetical protein